MVMNISCKFEKASDNTFFVRAVTVKSLYTLQRRGCNEAKSIVSTGCYPVDTMKQCQTRLIPIFKNTCIYQFTFIMVSQECEYI